MLMAALQQIYRYTYVFIYRKEAGIFYFMQKVIVGCLNFSSNRMATLTVKVNKE